MNQNFKVVKYPNGLAVHCPTEEDYKGELVNLTKNYINKLIKEKIELLKNR